MIDPNYTLPYTQQVNFTIEQQLGKAQTISAGYVGAFGSRLLGVVGIPPSKGNANVLGGSGVADTLLFYGNYANSNYDALQVKFQRQFAHNLGALASYTWSHSIDNESDTGTANANGSSFIAVPTAAEAAAGVPTTLLRASSDFDVRHAIGLSMVYDIPTAFAHNALARAALGHWSIDPIYHYQTALPIDVILNSTSNLAGETDLIQRPELIPGIPVTVPCPNCAGGVEINNTPVGAAAAASVGCAAPTAANAKGAFCTPLNVGSQAVSGDLGRNALRAFPLGEFDLSLHRDFPIHESIHLRFQADVYNVFNHPNFGPQSTNISTSTFGLATSMANSSLGANATSGVGFSPLFNTGGPRNVQFAMKLFF